MPINLYVAVPPGQKEDIAHWFLVTDHEGLSSSGSYPWAATETPPDDLRHAGYDLPFTGTAPGWRPATRDEAVAALWHTVIDDNA